MELDAKRYLGELLTKQEKSQGGRPPKTGTRGEPVSKPLKLSDLGITKKQSPQAQQLADMDDEDYEQFKSSTLLHV